MTTAEFIVAHRTDDPRQLALQASRFPDVDMPYALSQIQGWQAARRKLPSFAANQDIVYPPHLSMEQCSSEATALYKAEAVHRLLDSFKGEEDVSDKGFGDSMTDLTGGFGVDFYFVSRHFRRAQYTERNAELCQVVEHNFKVLGADNASVVCGDAVEQLRTIDPQTLIFIDPARRDAHGARTFAISDCTPDVMELLPDLRRKARFVMIKLSPMLDWHKAVADLGNVSEVHIISVKNECKELLLVLSAAGDGQGAAAGLRVCCVDCQPHADGAWHYVSEEYTDGDDFSGTPSCGFPSSAAPSASLSTALLQPGAWIYEPNASIMKAGCFAMLSARYGMPQVAQNSHLFLSESLVEAFPGRRFQVCAVTELNKKALRQALSGIAKANIAVRNFPLSVADLRKKLKLKDGGDTYIFATTLADSRHVLIITKKAPAQ